MRSIMMAGAMLVASHPAASEPRPVPDAVRVGIIDVRADRVLFKDPATFIAHREYNAVGRVPASWPTDKGADHGQVMLTAFVRQVRHIDADVPIYAYSANALEEKGSLIESGHGNGVSKRVLSINWDGASKALKWFKENNVKVVLTAFATTDGPALRGFMKQAQDLGMVVFASSGNKAGQPSYPAAYPQAISVASDGARMPIRTDPAYAGWVSFVMNGSVASQGYYSTSNEAEGSSFATARVAALGAYYASVNPSSGRDDVERAVASTSSSRELVVGRGIVSVRQLDEEQSAVLMRIMPRMVASSEHEDFDVVRTALLYRGSPSR